MSTCVCGRRLIHADLNDPTPVCVYCHCVNCLCEPLHDRQPSSPAQDGGS